jgi:hypothetical protein
MAFLTKDLQTAKQECGGLTFNYEDFYQISVCPEWVDPCRLVNNNLLMFEWPSNDSHRPHGRGHFCNGCNRALLQSISEVIEARLG